MDGTHPLPLTVGHRDQHVAAELDGTAHRHVEHGARIEDPLQPGDFGAEPLEGGDVALAAVAVA